jgi:hypothetical protein
MPNQEKLKDIRCPECLQTQRFALQMTLNVVMEDTGLDVMGSQPSDDLFEAKPVDPEEGLRDQDPIQCFARGWAACSYQGTIAEFRPDNQ